MLSKKQIKLAEQILLLSKVEKICVSHDFDIDDIYNKREDLCQHLIDSIELENNEDDEDDEDVNEE